MLDKKLREAKEMNAITLENEIATQKAMQQFNQTANVNGTGNTNTDDGGRNAGGKDEGNRRGPGGHRAGPLLGHGPGQYLGPGGKRLRRHRAGRGREGDRSRGSHSPQL